MYSNLNSSNMHIHCVSFVSMEKIMKENNGTHTTNVDGKCASVPSTATQALKDASSYTW